MLLVQHVLLLWGVYDFLCESLNSGILWREQTEREEKRGKLSTCWKREKDRCSNVAFKGRKSKRGCVHENQTLLLQSFAFIFKFSF